MRIKFIIPKCHFSSGIGFIISTFIYLSICQSSSAQDSSMITSPAIKWVEQYPFSQNKENQRKKSKFIDFILGKKNSLELTKPVNIIARSSNEYWVLDQANGAIFQVHQKVGDIPHIRNKRFSRFPSLVGFCFYEVNKMLFTDSYLNKIFVYNPEEKEITSLNDSLILSQPTGIAYSEVTHEIWVVETAAHSIAVLNEKGKLKKRIGRRGVEPGEFNYPTSIWIDKSGQIYVVDALNFRVQVFNKEGNLISLFGKNGDGSGNFARPKGIATDSFGNIYVADALYNAVQIFDLSGNFLYSFGTRGQDKGEFWMPSGIFIDSMNYIYVADCYNSKVQVFQLNYSGRK